MLTETMLEDDRWLGADLSALAECAARSTLDYLGLDANHFEISILGCNDAHITELNGDFRDKPRATNVLSWPSKERGAEIAGTQPILPGEEFDGELGDIAIAYDTCQREAASACKPFADHITHLVIHAVLHLLGYDHIRDEDATLMETTEVAILGKLGIRNPYCV